MALELAKLAAVFQSPPVASEADAIDYITTKWLEFFSGATTFGVPANAGALGPAKAAMAAAMLGISVPSVGAAKLQAGIVAFWGVVIPSAATIWVTVPPIGLVTAPAGLTGIAGALSPVFTTNTTGGKSLEESANALAIALLSTQLGGTATNTAPTPIVMPIL